MSVIRPEIDLLLSKAEDDRFLLCSVAARRARDINEMVRGQKDRALVLQSAAEIIALAGRKPLSLAMEEIARGEVSYDVAAFANSER